MIRRRVLLRTGMTDLRAEAEVYGPWAVHTDLFYTGRAITYVPHGMNINALVPDLSLVDARRIAKRLSSVDPRAMVENG